MTSGKKKSYEELLIQREFGLLEVTVEVVGNALLVEIERLRLLLRQHNIDYDHKHAPCCKALMVKPPRRVDDGN